VPFSAEARAARRDLGPAAWAGLAAVLAIGSCLVFRSGTVAALDWQPGLASREPWRAWTAAWVHYSALHLLANLTGSLLVAALGLAAKVPPRIVLAWFAAWPLTQLGLLLQPELLHYGGLSGVLHAGVAALAVHLIVAARGTRRLIGIGVLAGVAVKVLLEAPWGAALRHPAAWDIAVAPFAHLTGLLAGAAAAGVAEMLRRRPITIDRDD
jgi:rhomboid family GlyGly-CTERM serine protease